MSLLLPLFIGATYVEEVHPFYMGDREVITEDNAEYVTNNYGYFGETEFPTLIGDKNGWKIKLRWFRNTTKKIQIKLLYIYGQSAKLKPGDAGSNYYVVYEGPFLAGNVGSYTDFTISLSEALSEHGISTDHLDNKFTNCFNLGFFVDEHTATYQGKFYYITFPTTYASGKKYHFNVGHYSTNYICYPDGVNENLKEYYKRVYIGGRSWKNEIRCVGGGSFVDWRDFQNESRGEINSSYFSIPLKMELYGYTRANKPNLTVKIADANLFVYDGYEYYNFGEPTIGYSGEKGYKIPIRLVYDGTYYTLKPRYSFYITPDYRNIYFEETLPNGVNARNYIKTNSYVPIPAINGSTPVTFTYQIEILNAGPLGLVDITAKFSYTKSKNYFGSHSNSTYYVEEV